MNKKNFIKIILISTTLLILSVFIYYYQLIGKAQVLKDHYPVYDLNKNSYILVNKKPKDWVDIKSVSSIAKKAIIISEDWAYYQHDGIDRNQIEIAIKESLTEGRLTRGASTITQQVVKNALLSSEKTLTRKLKEVILAQALEKVLTKDKILEHYLNLIELGKDLYGIKNASVFYFQKAPSELSAKEGAFLAMLLPSPVKYSQSFRDGALTEFATMQVNEILLKLKQAKFITEDQRILFSKMPLSFEKEKLLELQVLPIDNPEAGDLADKEALDPIDEQEKETEDILKQIREDSVNLDENDSNEEF